MCFCRRFQQTSVFKLCFQFRVFLHLVMVVRRLIAPDSESQHHYCSKCKERSQNNTKENLKQSHQ